MAFIESSALTAGTSTLPQTLTQIQSATAKLTPDISGAAASSISKLSAVGAGVNGAIAGVNGAITAAQNTALKGINGVIKNLTTAIDSTVGGLAKSVNDTLTGAFGSTTNKAASTITTAISDPVLAITAKAPNSTGFKITADTVTANAAGIAGSASSFGTLASNMTGTVLSTVQNRYNLDSINGIGTSITSSLSKATTSGLFSNVKSLTTAFTSPISSIRKTIGNVAATVSGVQQTVKAVSTNIRSTTNALARDFTSFKNSVSSVESVLGVSNLENMFVGGSKTSLMVGGVGVDTNGTGVDASVANALNTLARSAGCTITTQAYTSASLQASLFGTTLSIAAIAGMKDLMASLLGCDIATSSLGQQALSNAFGAAATTQIGLAGDILDKLDGTTMIDSNMPKAIMNNPNLIATDASTVTAILARLDTTPIAALSVPSAISTTTPLIDLATASNANTSFLNSIMGTSTVSDFLASTPMAMNTSGLLAVA